VTRPRLVLVATSLAAFTATLDNTVVAVALRDMQVSLGSGVSGLQGIVTAYTVALAALLLAGGALVDVAGAKRVLLAGVAVFGTASAGCAAAGTVSELIAWRAVQGAGAALVLPGGLAVLAASYPDPIRRRRAVGIWAASAGVALVTGPIVGGALVAARGWPSVFWVNLPLCALVAALVIPAPSGPRRPRSLDVPGALLTCAVLGPMAYGVVLAGRGGSAGRAALCGLVALVALAALVVVERRQTEPLLPADLVRDRHFSGATLGAFAGALAVFVLLVFLSLYLQLVQDFDAAATGVILLPLPAALIATSALTGRWHAVVLPVTVGLVVAGVGLTRLGLVLDATSSRTEIGVLLALIGVGVGLTTAPLVTAALAAAGEPRAGLAAAGVSTARELGGVIAIGGLGSVAVARLSGQLTEALADAGVTAAGRPALVDALLGARKPEVRRLLLDELGLDRTLALNQALSDTATASFLTSTQLVLVLAGGVLLASALVCGLTLRAQR
jgi:DHA2 family methylenomycin A resistance protein-like MFS transporter